MKRAFYFFRCTAVLCVVALLTFLPTLPVFADVWVPPDDHSYAGFDSEAGLRLVSLFVSNYAETGMTSYAADTPAAVLCPLVLKDLELNASQFKSGVTVQTDAAGVQFMAVTPEQFEQRAGVLFPRSMVRAADCPGYGSSGITVTAPNANGAIDIAATVDYVAYDGDDTYTAQFTVWHVDAGSPSAVYGSTDNVPTEKATALTTGNCRFSYQGDKEAKNISTWELELIGYRTKGSFAASSAVLGQNEAYTPSDAFPSAQTSLSETSVPVTESNGVTKEEGGDQSSVSDTVPQTDSPERRGVLGRLFGGRQSGETKGVLSERSDKSTLYIVIVLAVAVIVILAVLIITVVIKKH